MGSSRPRKSTPARKAHSVKRPTSSSNEAASRPPRNGKPRIPPAIEIAIDDQRGDLGTAISLLYGLHSALRRQIDDSGGMESEAVKEAAKRADLTDITEMLLVRLNSIHSALDYTELVRAKVDPEAVQIAEMAREMFDNDDREPS